MITSTANPLVKDLARLRTPRHRRSAGRFLIEGRRPLEMAFGAGVRVDQVVVCPELGGRAGDWPVDVVEMTEAPFRKVSVRQKPDGVLGVARLLDTGLPPAPTNGPLLVLVAEAVEKPGNLGAMLRTADATGVAVVMVTDPTTDIHNPNVVRASQGALFTVPVAITTMPEALAWLDTHSIRLVALSPAAATTLWETDLTGRVAVAVGSESPGLSPPLTAAAETTVMLPMQGSVDSLNVSVVAAVALFEACRQRSQT